MKFISGKINMIKPTTEGNFILDTENNIISEFVCPAISITENNMKDFFREITATEANEIKQQNEQSDNIH